MTIATRLTSHEDKSFRPLHVAGNQLVCGIINWMFHSRVSDIFSGYRAFTREAIRQIPVTTRGFDIETELTLQSLYRGQVIQEMPAPIAPAPPAAFPSSTPSATASASCCASFSFSKLQAPHLFRRARAAAVSPGAGRRRDARL